ncbi:hypothetical protein FE394_15500 [Xenorhabdus sp. Reich]|uniref:Uncharacterized protein n=1 Tax=Xenorhabdus littoralis TaxID=2582835 RepID=A0ABU4SPK5_9GAMM|nr:MULTISPECIES: hypothetical protein [unclassified Xenorhabdus]MDX7991257.1 hypothetical protein [Xenorhabdus sp. psl]MDX8000562.1 hypothetical protein [Xenorhabdus sp. Reich]
MPISEIKNYKIEPMPILFGIAVEENNVDNVDFSIMQQDRFITFLTNIAKMRLKITQKKIRQQKVRQQKGKQKPAAYKKV